MSCRLLRVACAVFFVFIKRVLGSSQCQAVFSGLIDVGGGGAGMPVFCSRFSRFSRFPDVSQGNVCFFIIQVNRRMWITRRDRGGER